MNMVRAALVADPKVKNKELFNRAKEIAPEAMKGMNMRQFHATYRLPAAKERAIKNGTIKPRQPRTTKAAASPGGNGRIRSILIDFAQDVAGAESRADLIKVMADVDKVVAKITKGTGE